MDQPGSSAAPISPPTGLDYTFTPAPQPGVSPPLPGRKSQLPTGIIAFLSAVIGALVTVGLLSVAGLFATEEPIAQPVPTTTVAPVAAAAPTNTAPSEPGIDVAEAVWEKVFPSIVTVQVGTEDAEGMLITASGSGVALGNGYIATNHHVIDGAEVTQIVLQDGRVYDAEVVGSDAYTDLAVLSTNASDLVPVEIGSIDDLAIGQVTIAVGNPLGQAGGSSLTVGVLSALSRRVDFDNETSLFGMLQTDAPITNGSSGGALVDENGRLIGITSAIGLSQAGAEGIGYAIPVNVVERITNELIESGVVRHAFLGILGGDYVETAADGARIPAGALVIDVDPPDGAAGRAGLQPEDVIVAMAGVEIQTMNDLVVQLRLFRVDDTIDIGLERDGEQLTVSVTLDERPEGV